MPTLPATDGLPVWAQIVVSILICVATLAIAFKGYFRNPTPESKGDTTTTVALSAASIMDMGAVRHLSDTVIHLDASVRALTDIINDATHYERNSLEQSRELCRRLRELRETLERRQL